MGFIKTGRRPVLVVSVKWFARSTRLKLLISRRVKRTRSRIYTD